MFDRRNHLVLTVALTLTAGLFLFGLRIGGGISTDRDGDAYPANFVVDEIGDLPDFEPGDGVCRICLSPDGDGGCDQFGGCTLRAAIEEANASADTDRIEFAVASVTPVSPLPAITGGVVVDGGGTFALDGRGVAAIPASNPALDFEAAGNELRDIEILMWRGVGAMFRAGDNHVENVHVHDNGLNGSDSGLEFRDGADNLIVNSRIEMNGHDRTGGISTGDGILLVNVQSTIVQGCTIPHNAGDGILAGDIYGDRPPGIISDLTIGGVTESPGTPPGNVLSGNSGGINILTAGGNGTTVIQGNMVGPDPSGTSELASAVTGDRQETGFDVSDPAPEQILVGGTDAGARNVFSGHRSSGVVTDAGVEVVGNYIGTDISGSAPLGNGDGVEFVGSGAMVRSNVISGNSEDGLVLGFSSGDGNLIEDNLIGVAADGSTPLGNGRAGIGLFWRPDETEIRANVISGNGSHGIWLFGDDDSGRPAGTVVAGNAIGTGNDDGSPAANGGAGVRIEGADNTTVGGESDGDGNTIAYNEGAGVRVSQGSGNSVLRNSIFENGGLGIDLGAEGVTINDEEDADEGPNSLMNRPAVTWVESDGGSTHISGRLSAAPERAVRIEVFGSEELDDSGSGEGRTFLDAIDVTTDESGTATFLISRDETHRYVTATATDADGNTSEFSRQPIVVNSSTDRADAASVDGRCDTGQMVGDEPECTLRAAIQTANAEDGKDHIGFEIPGAAPHFIQPSSPLPAAAGPLVIDGTTASASGDSRPPIRLSGVSAGSASGLTIDASDIVVQGLLIRDFEQHGVFGRLDPQMELAAVQILSNDGDGVYAPVGGVNLSSEATVPLDLTAPAVGYDLVVGENRDSGIRAVDDVSIAGAARVSGNGAERTPEECITQDLAGIQTTGNILTGAIEVTDNCGDGVYASGPGPLYVGGDSDISGNTRFGIRAVHGLLMEGDVHDVSENGSDGVFAPNGEPVEIRGALRVVGNGRLQDPSECSGPGATHAGLGTGGALTTDAVVASDNCGTGLFADGDASPTILIKGDATVRGNGSFGIFARGNDIVLRGETNDVSSNGRDGIFTSNGSVELAGTTIVSENGHVIRGDLPSDCESRLHAGVASQLDVLATRLTANGNCGSGVVGFGTLSIEAATVIGNDYHGLSGKSVALDAGTVCRNGGYGIAAAGGPLDLGPVKVCENGLGGVLGEDEEESTSKYRAASTPASTSGVTGADLVDNEGDGIRVTWAGSLSVERSNLEGNTGSGIANSGPGTVTANGNWWGAPSGPEDGNGTSGAVEVSDWREMPVSLVAVTSADTLILPRGTNDTLSVFIRNRTHPDEMVDVLVEDTQDWVVGETSFAVDLDEFTGSIVRIPFSIPVTGASDTADRITITVTSSTDPSTTTSDTVLIATSETATSVPEPVVTPDAFRLHGNYPNPFRTRSRILFDLPVPADVRLTVRDVLGRVLLETDGRRMQAGLARTIDLDAGHLAAGIYVYRVTARAGTGTFVRSGRLVVIK